MRRCDVAGLGNITQVSADWLHTAGLKPDGTVVASGLEVELAKWNL